MPQTSGNQKSGPDVEILEKDAAEKKLESLLFGDDDAFQSALRSTHDPDSMALTTVDDGSGDEEMEDEETGIYDQNLEDVADADLFFLDSGAGPVSTELEPPATPAYSAAGEDDDEETDELPAVWHDSDDERLTVSLAGKDRLRKLRLTEEEDIINGKEYVRRLQRQYQALHPTPDWANPNLKKNDEVGSDDEDRPNEVDSDDEETSIQPLAKLLQSVDFTKVEDNSGPGGKRKLRKEVIGIARLKDIGKDQPSAVSSLTFHPHYPIILSSGPASTLFLHHIAPDAPAPNPLLTSLHIRQTPITTSVFTPSGNQIYASGRRRFFHLWDLNTGKIDKVNGSGDRTSEQKSMEHLKISPCGRYVGIMGSTKKGGGVVNIHNSGTAQWVAQVRVDGRGGVADFAWWRNGEGMTVANLNGEVSEWDGRLNRVIARWKDAGGVGTTVIRLGGDSGRPELGGDHWVGIGSRSGIVNIYDRREWGRAYAKHISSKQADATDASSAIPSNPEPVRALDQLVTPVSHIEFAPDGQFFAIASDVKKDALRLIHLPTCTVYRNWPTSNTPLGRITSVAISPNSEYLAVGNDRGRIRLWEISG